MDIHKPKPWHGFREFLKEYAIIVLGVLTALAAEALVQRMHESRVSEEARAAVRAEINLDLANIKRRLPVEPCVQRRFAELGAFVSDAEAGATVAPPVNIGAPGNLVTYTQRWDAATAGGRTSLLSLDEQRDLPRVYAQFRYFLEMQQDEREAWGELLGLEGVRLPSKELLARARGALGRARLLDIGMQRSIAEASTHAARIGIKGEDSTLLVMRSGPDLRASLCLPLAAPPTSAQQTASRGVR